jgi:hypothetical protein
MDGRFKALYFDVTGDIRPILIGPTDGDFPQLREDRPAEDGQCFVCLSQDLFLRIDHDNERLSDEYYLGGLPVNLALRRYFPNSPLVGPAVLCYNAAPEWAFAEEGEEPEGVYMDLQPSHLDYLAQLRLVFFRQVDRIRDPGSNLRWGAAIVDSSDLEGLDPTTYSDVPVPTTVRLAITIVDPLTYDTPNPGTIFIPEKIIDHDLPDRFYSRYLQTLRLEEIETKARGSFHMVLEELMVRPRR